MRNLYFFQLQVEASLTMLMGYYNSRLALWEPLIEPVEVIDEKGLMDFVPWEIKMEVIYKGYLYFIFPHMHNFE